MRRHLSLRMRWALWCALVVTVSGVVVVVITLELTRDLLGTRTQEELVEQGFDGPPGRPADAPRPPPGEGPPPGLEVGARIADSVFEDVRWVGVGVAAGLAVVSLGIGWVVAGRMVRPLAEITELAGEVSGARLGDRIDVDGPHDELRELSETFNAMLDRLDAAFDAQRAFSAEASHELRTPLAVLRAEIDVALDDPDATPEELRATLDGLRDSVDDMTRLVAALLALSRADALSRVERHDLAMSFRDALDRFPCDGRRVVTSLDAAPVRGDRLLLDRLAANLVENADRYTPVDGTIEVRTGVEHGRSVAVVGNDGPAFDDEMIERALARFDRPTGTDRTAAGSGLGLSIVAAIVRSHGADLDVRPRDGGGLTVAVRFATPTRSVRGHDAASE